MLTLSLHWGAILGTWSALSIAKLTFRVRYNMRFLDTPPFCSQAAVFVNNRKHLESSSVCALTIIGRSECKWCAITGNTLWSGSPLPCLNSTRTWLLKVIKQVLWFQNDYCNRNLITWWTRTPSNTVALWIGRWELKSILEGGTPATIKCVCDCVLQAVGISAGPDLKGGITMTTRRSKSESELVTCVILCLNYWLVIAH